MSEEAKKLYKEAFYQFFNKMIDIVSYDNKVENACLYFGPSNDINCNINSNYFSILNNFYFSKFSSEDINKLENKKEIDNEVLELVARTYIECIKKDGVSGIMYNPPKPEHYVVNGSLVLEFVYGKNTKKISDDEYMDIYRKQKDFINSMVEELKKEVTEKLGINCEIFISKRVKTNV